MHREEMHRNAVGKQVQAGKSKCKGPEVEIHIVCWRKCKEVNEWGEGGRN